MFFGAAGYAPCEFAILEGDPATWIVVGLS